MPRRSRADLAALDALVTAQLGVVATRQLRQLRMPSSAIHHRIRSDGPWSRILPAVYLTSRGEPDREQQRQAVRLYAGDDAVLTGADALDLRGIRLPRRRGPWPVHVLVPHATRRASTGFALVERTRRLPRATLVGGNPVTPIERAVVDLCRRLQSRNDVTAVVARAVQEGRASVAALAAEVELAPIRYTALIREAVAAISDGVASAPEAELRRLWLKSALPVPLWNPDLYDRSGRFVARPDAYLPDVGLAVEIESKEYHFSVDGWERTMRRQSGMTAFGVTVLQYPPSALRLRPEQVFAQIGQTRRRLAGRPAPDVVVKPQRPS